MSSADYIFGLHAVEKALQHSTTGLKEVWVDQSRHDKRIKQIIELAEKKQVAINRVTSQEIDALLPDGQHQGVLASLDSTRSYAEADLKDIIESSQGQALLLVLDGVQDPHNLGACLRSADAAGVNAVIAPKDKSSSITPVVRKVACGAAEHVPFIQVSNLARCLKNLQEQGIWLVGTSDTATQTIYDMDLKGPIALVMGGEGKGLRRLTQEHCDYLAAIPMKGSVESLNVSVATGVCLYEVVRQRQ